MTLPELKYPAEFSVDATAHNFRALFPIFRRQPSVVYLDSAATAQKPEIVLDAERRYFETACSNSGRGLYEWAYRTTEIVEAARQQVAHFIGAASSREVVFTSGCTMSLNLVTLSWGEANLLDGDEILICGADHRSMNDPWRLLQKRFKERGVEIKLVPYRLLSSGQIDTNQLSGLITNRTRLVNVTHINNVAGVPNNLKQIRDVLPPTVLLNLDVAQSVSHMAINVSELGADFVSFSGHKIFSSSGIGVLFARKELHSQLRAVFVGGGQKNIVRDEFQIPEALEAGTLNVGGIVSLQAAIIFIENIGRQKIHRHLQDLTKVLYDKLSELPQIEFLYGLQSNSTACGLLSFNVKGYSATDVGDFLADQYICVRYGDHCAGSAFGLESENDSVRVSLNIYNTDQEIDLLCRTLGMLPLRN